MKAFPLLLICYLTQSVVAYDMQRDQNVTLEKDRRIQIIQVKNDKTVFTINNQYYQIDSDKLRCR